MWKRYNAFALPREPTAERCRAPAWSCEVSDFKQQAEALRVGLLAGYVRPLEAVEWADGIIAAGNVPGSDLIAVSLGGSKPADELARALGAIPGEVSPVLLLLSPEYLVHFDFQSGHDSSMLPRRLRLYNGVLPNTLQDILEEALEPWLRSNGYLS